MRYNEIINLKDNIYFLNISKNGCSYLKNISNILHGIKYDYDTIEEFHILFNKYNTSIVIDNNFVKNDEFIFAVWRNPIDRLLSLYKDIKYGHLSNYYNVKINNLNDLILMIENNIDYNPDRHFRRQIDYIKGVNIDLIVKIEDLDEYIKKMFNVSHEHLNAINHNLDGIIDTNIMSKIYNLYKDDFTILENNKNIIYKNYEIYQ